MSSSSPFELPRSVSLRSIRVRFRSASMDHRWMTRGIVDRSALYRCEEPPGRCDVVVGNIPSSVAPTLTAFERSTTSPVSMICAQTYYGISQKADNINTGQPTVVSRLLCKFGARSSALEPAQARVAVDEAEQGAASPRAPRSSRLLFHGSKIHRRCTA